MDQEQASVAAGGRTEYRSVLGPAIVSFVCFAPAGWVWLLVGKGFRPATRNLVILLSAAWWAGVMVLGALVPQVPSTLRAAAQQMTTPSEIRNGTEAAEELEVAEPPPPLPNPVRGERILDEATTHTARGTRIELQVAIPRDTTKRELDAFLRHLHRERMARPGSDRQREPTAMRARVYLEGVDWKADPRSWVARVTRAPGARKPHYRNELPGGSLADQVRAAVEDVEVETRQDTVHLTHTLDASTLLGAMPTRRAIRHAMLWSAFFTMSTLYAKVGEVDRLTQRFVYDGGTIGEITTTLETYRAIDHAEVMKGVAEAQDAATEAELADEITSAQRRARADRAERQAHRTLLDRLPEDAVHIDRKYQR